MAYPPKIPAQIGIPIKIVDTTSTSNKIAKIQNFEPQKIIRATVVGKRQSTPPPGVSCYHAIYSNGEIRAGFISVY